MFRNSYERLGSAPQVRYLPADVLRAALPAGQYAVWHDRAAFHFLTASDHARYVAQAHRALRPGGALVLGTFAPAGPHRCCGLEVGRYSAETLRTVFSPHFQLLDAREEAHLTPGGQVQPFTFVVLRRLP